MAYVQEKSVYVILVIDSETSGLSPDKNAITQITAEAFRSDTLEPIGVFNKYVYPYKKRVISPDKVKTTKSKRAVDAPVELELMEYSPKALQVTGITMEKLYEEGEQIALPMNHVVEIATQAGLDWDTVGAALKREGRLHLETY